MYPIYITDGIVLRKLPVGEANILTSVLTRDHGLIRASVRSARAAQSKLRFGIEPFTVGRFSFVRGRHEWRLVGTEPQTREVLRLPATHRAALGRIAKLLLRLVPGADPSSSLYLSLMRGMEALTGAREQEVEAIECVVVLRLIDSLGYVPHTPDVTPFIEEEAFTKELIERATSSRAALIRTINSSLHASGL